MVFDALFTGSLWIPMGLWVFNLVMRLGKKLQVSSGADWMLVLVAFDLAAVLAASDFRKFVPHADLAQGFPSIMIVLALVTLVGWGIILSIVEPAFERSGDHTVATFSQRVLATMRNPKSIFSSKVFNLLLAMVLLVTITGLHVHVFTYTGD